MYEKQTEYITTFDENNHEGSELFSQQFTQKSSNIHIISYFRFSTYVLNRCINLEFWAQSSLVIIVLSCVSSPTILRLTSTELIFLRGHEQFLLLYFIADCRDSQTAFLSRICAEDCVLVQMCSVSCEKTPFPYSVSSCSCLILLETSADLSVSTGFFSSVKFW
jgi:hypothetical protein